MDEPPLASCLVRVTQTASACLTDSCKSSELSNPPGLSTGAHEKRTRGESCGASSLVLPVRDGAGRPRLGRHSRCLLLVSHGVESEMAAQSCMEGGPRGPSVYGAMRHVFFFSLFEFQPVGLTLTLLWEVVCLKSEEFGLGHLRSPLASTVGRQAPVH